jgi:hypothetical protein
MPYHTFLGFGAEIRIVLHYQTYIKIGVCYILRFKNLQRPGIEPGSTAWEGAMLTIKTPSH